MLEAGHWQVERSEGGGNTYRLFESAATPQRIRAKLGRHGKAVETCRDLRSPLLVLLGSRHDMGQNPSHT